MDCMHATIKTLKEINSTNNFDHSFEQFLEKIQWTDTYQAQEGTSNNVRNAKRGYRGFRAANVTRATTFEIDEKAEQEWLKIDTAWYATIKSLNEKFLRDKNLSLIDKILGGFYGSSDIPDLYRRLNSTYFGINDPEERQVNKCYKQLYIT